MAAVMACATFAGCKQDETKPAPAAAPQASAVVVGSQADGIHLKTPQAEFVLTAQGNLLASRKDGATTTTIDEASQNGGIVVKGGSQAIGDFVRDLSHAETREANGKLGKIGKHVEVKGHSASTGLDEVLTVEVYDDFPSLALLSATYKNSGGTDVALKNVELQKHRLSATLADSGAGFLGVPGPVHHGQVGGDEVERGAQVGVR